MIILVFLLIGAVLFIPTVRTLFDEFTKSEEQREKERARAKQLADEGLQDKFARFLFGNNFVDRSKSNRAAKLQEEANRKIKEQQAKNHGFKSVAEFEKATDPNRDVGKFNPKGIIGYGILSINNGKGLKDTPENRAKLEALKIPATSSFRKRGKRRHGVR